MTKPASLLAAVLVAFTSVAYAADDQATEKKRTSQQIRMKECNAQAKEQTLKGDERKRFMSSCLKGNKQ